MRIGTNSGTGATAGLLQGRRDLANELVIALGGLDITGAVFTADALHTQVATARFLVEEKKAHFVPTVKANQPTLYASCRALPWRKATAEHYDRSRGHGRTETRVVQVLTVSHFAFPT